MALATNLPIIDFVILDLHDPNLLGVADKSYYPQGFTILNPTVEITPPSFPKATITYTTKDLNSYNSNDLNITCVTDLNLLSELPDGIYTVKMSISPEYSYSKTKSFIRTTNIRRKFGVAVMNTDINCCGADVKKQQQAYLDEISYYIECAIANGNDCNSLIAMSLYREANKMLNDLINNKPNFYSNPGYYLSGN